MRKKISVIIPALNEEKLIERLLSLFTDDFKVRHGIEVIVSDGGSTDRTVSISEKYADRIVKKDINTSQNISRGRNAGAKASQGDVLVFLNADTLPSEPDRLFEAAIRELSNEKVSAVACRIEVMPHEKILSDALFHGIYNSYVKLLNYTPVGMGRGECHIISRRAFETARGYDENIAAGEDFELYSRLKRSGKIVYRGDLVVFESPRRYRRFGYIRILGEWALNSLSVFFFKRSVSKVWEPIR